MNSDIIKTVLAVTGLAMLLGGSAAAQNLQKGDIDTGYFGNVALEGYDTVAYFTVGKAMIGRSGHHRRLARRRLAVRERRKTAISFSPIPWPTPRNMAATARMAWPMMPSAVQSNIDPNPGGSSTASSTSATIRFLPPSSTRSPISSNGQTPTGRSIRPKKAAADRKGSAGPQHCGPATSIKSGRVQLQFRARASARQRRFLEIKGFLISILSLGSGARQLLVLCRG